jgi:hypothetical protein
MHILSYTGTVSKSKIATSQLSRTSALLALALVSISLHAQQNSFTAIHGNTDQGVVSPRKSPVAGRQDPAALVEVRAYQKAIGLAAWTDMQGTGSITLNTADKGVENTSLSILGQSQYRLDVETSKGTKSTRMNGAVGAVQYEDGHKRPVDATDAGAGLFGFPLLNDSNFPEPRIGLVDNGIVSIDGVPLHRITVEWPWAGDPVDTNGNVLTNVVDFYFNPQTHLLMKTANAVVGSKPSPTRLLRVISYDDYRVVNGMEVPYRYRQTLNGQLMWTLQLNQVQLHIGLASSSFLF